MRMELWDILQKYENDMIALYGLGVETEKILKQLAGKVRIAGLLDGYKEEGILYGMHIISFAEAVRCGVRLILVVARPGSCRAIAKRIGEDCIRNQIDLLDLKGSNLCCEQEVSYDLKKMEGITKAGLMELLDRHDVISVDLFDTLVMRNTLFNTDVYEMVDSRLRSMGICYEDFSRKRMTSEKELSCTGAPTLKKIYEHMIASCNLQGISAQALAGLEWETDFELLIPRKELCKLISGYSQIGKPIYIVSDSYYSKKQIQKIIEKCDIKNYMDILVSCEYGTGKQGQLFEILKKEIGEKTCIHMGDDFVADIEAGRQNRLDVCQIHSGVDLLEGAGYFGTWKHIINLSDKIKAGMFVAKIFNSPFQFETTERRITVDTAYDIGYLFLAPMITDFVLWFERRVRTRGLDHIWFSARDGYLVKLLYDELTGDNKSIYFLTSRIAAIRAGIESEADIHLVEQMKFAGSLVQQLKDRFGVIVEDESFREGARLIDYKEVILDRTRICRKNYQKYISNLKLGNADGDIAFFDFVAKGTCQMFVQKLVKNHFRGLYFLQLEKENMQDRDLDIESFYNSDDLEGNTLYEDYYILETVLTSQVPSIVGFDGNGAPVYAPESRSSIQIACAVSIQEGIRSYFHTYLQVCPIEERCINKSLDELFLALIHGIEISDKDFAEMRVEDPFFNRNTQMRDLV